MKKYKYEVVKGAFTMQLKDNVFKYIGLLAKQGMLGRKMQVINCLSQEMDAGFNVNQDKYRMFYQQIRKQYTEIRLHRLWSTRLGEYMPRYMLAVENSAENAKKGILDVFVLTDCVNRNLRLIQIMKRYIQIIDETNIEMWKYVLCRFPKVEFNKYWEEYTKRNNAKLLKPENTVRYFILTEDEKKEGQYKKQLMGLENPYVCFSSRDAGYLDVIAPKLNRIYKYRDYRDSDINRFNLSANYLEGKGITSVRVGRYMKNKVDFGNCIDYSTHYYDEFMDIFLMLECKFYVGDTNGICSLPMSFNKPVALKNYFPFLMDTWGAFPQTSQNLLIFKKYYKKREERFLSLDEMLQLEANTKVIYDARRFLQLGIEVVENSAEEILDLVMEMNARIDGEWIETQEDIELQEEYRNIYKKWCKKKNFNENAVYQGRIGALFLRKNRFLLEKK